MHGEVPPPPQDMGAAPGAVPGSDQMGQPQVPIQAPVQAPAPDAPLPPESTQPPAEAVMMTDDASGQPSTSLVIKDLFKKASAIIESIAPVALTIDKKRDGIYGIFFEIDKMLDKTYPEMLGKVGKLEETFTPKNIASK